MPGASKLEPQARHGATPVVLVSSAAEDYRYCDRIIGKLRVLLPKDLVLDDSGFETEADRLEEVISSFSFGSIFVVLLSPDYLKARTAPVLSVLAREARSGRLRLIPIVVRKSPLDNGPELRGIQVWPRADSLEHLSATGDLERELVAIAREIFELLRTPGQRWPRPTEQPKGRGSPSRSEFTFSPSTNEILLLARQLMEKSKRARVSSSCLFFAFASASQNGVIGAFREALERTHKYDECFNKFLTDGEKTREGSNDGGEALGKVSLNMRRTLERAQKFSQRTAPSLPEVHPRHLLAALLIGDQRETPPTAQKRLAQFGIEAEQLRRTIRSSIQTHEPNDNQAEWDAILIGAVAPDDYTTGSAGYRSTYAAFENDLVAFDSRSYQEPLKDPLKNAVYAKHLAQLIVAQKTHLPLSLGLFGDWGSGKSYFIRLLHQEVESLSTKGDKKVFCPKVVQIHFNAWHYLDTNLWANLVCEIFDNLFSALSKRQDTNEDKVKALKKKLTEESALAAEARKALDDAKNAREEAEKKLKDAVTKRKEQESTVTAFIDDLKRVAADAGLQAQLKTLADGFGLSRLSESFTELEARATEARTLVGRFRTLGLALLSPEGRWQRLGLLFVALALPVVLAVLVPKILGMEETRLADFTRSITAAAALLGTVATWISTQTKRGTDLLQKLETAYGRVKSAREEARKAQQPSSEQAELDKRIKEEADAQHAANDAQTKVRAIEAELRELAPGRRLLKFLEQRSGANDYRQYLGLVSLVRRDFEELSRLLREGNEFKEGDQPMLDRIVLYVDDLDRCKPDRVIEVLEAVHLLLAFPIFAVVVAVDPRWLRKSLVEHYPMLLGSQTPAGSAPTNHESRENQASPQDYLEKIFQLPFQLERLEEKGFKRLVNDILSVQKGRQQPSEKPSANAGAPVGQAAQSQPSGEHIDTASHSPESSQPATPVTPTVAVGATPSGSQPPTSQEAEPEKEPSTEAPPAERLELEKWERAAVELCYPLFRTPRAVKRLANTYCLIRTGVEAKEWAEFIGSEGMPAGQYRTPLLMLAVAAAYPRLSWQWLDGLRAATGWKPAQASESGAPRIPGREGQADWDDLADALKLMDADKFVPFDTACVQKWVPRVKRYSF